MRKDDKDLWLKALKEQLEDHSEPIPAGGWDRLEQALNVPAVPKKIIPLRKWAYVGIAATIALLFGIGSLFMIDSISQSEEMQIVQQVTSDFEPDVLPSSSEPIEISTIVPSAGAKKGLAQVEKISKKQSTLDAEPSSSLPVINELSIEVQEENRVGSDNQQAQIIDVESVEKTQKGNEETKNTKNRESSSVKERTTERSSSDKLHIPVSSKKRDKRRWSMGISGGSAGLMANNGETSNSNMFQMSAMLTNDQLSQLEEGSITLSTKEKIVIVSGIPYRVSSNVVEYDHHQPISVGFSFRKYLTDKLSLSTGLMYTYLTSDMKIAEEGEEYKMTQKFHYLGVPIKVNYDFYQYKSFQLYASAGGSIERAVYGKQGNNKVTNNRFQFSVSGAVGAQINLSRRVGFYVEPGVAYYFNDGSAFETIRSDRPFNFDINAGIRFSY
ncbi:MAG: PorT family protein [Bacteroidales bacterium]|nr:PorT family protein [Bacteroidales bacterium]